MRPDFLHDEVSTTVFCNPAILSGAAGLCVLCVGRERKKETRPLVASDLVKSEMTAYLSIRKLSVGSLP